MCVYVGDGRMDDISCCVQVNTVFCLKPDTPLRVKIKFLQMFRYHAISFLQFWDSWIFLLGGKTFCSLHMCFLKCIFQLSNPFPFWKILKRIKIRSHCSEDLVSTLLWVYLIIQPCWSPACWTELFSLSYLYECEWDQNPALTKYCLLLLFDCWGKWYWCLGT